MKWLQLLLLLTLGSTLTSHVKAQTVVDAGTMAATDNAALPAPTAPAAPLPAAPLPAAPPPAPSREWLKAVYEQVADSVVLIETEFGTGSGFFFHEPALVATALHVVDDAETIVVQTSDGRRQTGRVVAYSRNHD